MSQQNPYQSTAESAPERAQPVVWIAPIVVPGGASDCSYYSYEAFAEELTRRLVESCQTFGMRAVVLSGVAEGSIQQSDCQAMIRCRIESITEYRISFWQRIMQFLPLGYNYFPASFTISGAVESADLRPQPFRIHRQFDKGRLGQKANMSVGIGSEAMRIVSIVGKALPQTASPTGRSSFWLTMLLVPLSIAVLLALGIFFAWPNIAARLKTELSKASIEATILGGLMFLAAYPISIACLPAWVYEHPSFAWAYRFASTRSSLVLRLYFTVLGLLTGVPLIAFLMNAWWQFQR